MSYWCDDAALDRSQRTLDARQQEAKKRMASKTLGEAITSGNWTVRQEARGEWSVYRGMGYAKGPFRTETDARTWMDDHLTQMMEVGAA